MLISGVFTLEIEQEKPALLPALSLIIFAYTFNQIGGSESFVPVLLVLH